MEKCTGDWIFMTEAHEYLYEGQNILLMLDELIPEQAHIAMVLRMYKRERWGFPWLCKNRPCYRYRRASHNLLDFPSGSLIAQLEHVITYHERVHETEVRREVQRKAQNRRYFMERWKHMDSGDALYYLAQEWRRYDSGRAQDRLEELLAARTRNEDGHLVRMGSGPMRYHARMLLAQIRMNQFGDAEGAREALIGCVGDDWTRTEHWLCLGDLAFTQEKYGEALQFYKYGISRVGDPPFSVWWINLDNYGHIPAQKLASAYAMLGNLEQALHWAEEAAKLLPKDAANYAEALDECDTNIAAIKEALANATNSSSPAASGSSDQRQGADGRSVSGGGHP
jgi:tetratricopeptide (TPR) repeat protein